MLQSPAPVPPAMLQLMPEPLGRLSLSVTERAVPGPPLLTTIEKPIWSPVLTGVASAVFTTPRLGQLMVIGTGPALGLPSLEGRARRVVDRGAGAERRRRNDVDVEAGAEREVLGPEAEHAAAQVPGSGRAGWVDGPAQAGAGWHRVADRHVARRAEAGVGDGDRVADLVACADRACVSRLAELDVRAVDHDADGAHVRAAVVARDGAGRVVDHAAGGGGGRRGDVHARAGARTEGRRAVAQHAAAD